jgi:hypothetical protein
MRDFFTFFPTCFHVFSAIAAVLGSVCLPSALRASPITSDPGDPVWLYQSGSPFFFCGPGDPENFLHRGSTLPDGTRSGDQDQIIQKLAGTGANSLWMTAVRSHGGDGDATENPFLDHDPALGVNPAVLDQWDAWIETLDAAGIVTFFVFYDDGSNVWGSGTAVPAAEAEFFAAVVERLDRHDHLIWCIAEEYQEALPPARVSALAALIDANDDHDHPIAVHQTPGTTFHFADDPVIDCFAMQSAGGDTPASLHDKVLEAKEIADGRYNVTMSETVGHYTDRESTRKLNWAAAMGGAYVMVQAMDVAGTPVEALEDCGRLVDFFRSTPFHVMESRDATARGETEFVLGDPDVGFIAYSANATVNLGINIPPAGVGTYELTWMNCETGFTVVQPDVDLGEGDEILPKPTGIGTEAVLYAVLEGGASSVAPESWGLIKSRFHD